MDNDVILALASENPGMGGVDQLVNIYWALSGVLAAGVPGAVVEVGCHEGRTSVFLRKVADHFAPGRELHVYDSFEGLPPPGPNDTDYSSPGQLRTRVEDLTRTFARWDAEPPHVHAGWFADTLPRELPDRVCFAYVDGDLYESIRTALTELYPRLSPGAIVIVDDYCDEVRSPRAFAGFPGVKKACDEFFADKPERISVLVGTGKLAFGYFRKT
ncbi:TylF/MycF/NovP-related O-methyltransferase [Spirillospora sp. CA-253888]